MHGDIINTMTYQIFGQVNSNVLKNIYFIPIGPQVEVFFIFITSYASAFGIVRL